MNAIQSVAEMLGGSMRKFVITDAQGNPYLTEKFGNTSWDVDYE